MPWQQDADLYTRYVEALRHGDQHFSPSQVTFNLFHSLASQGYRAVAGHSLQPELKATVAHLAWIGTGFCHLWRSLDPDRPTSQQGRVVGVNTAVVLVNHALWTMTAFKESTRGPAVVLEATREAIMQWTKPKEAQGSLIVNVESLLAQLEAQKASNPATAWRGFRRFYASLSFQVGMRLANADTKQLEIGAAVAPWLAAAAEVVCGDTPEEIAPETVHFVKRCLLEVDKAIGVLPYSRQLQEWIATWASFTGHLTDHNL